MKIDSITLKGVGNLNEDALILNEATSLFGVADGVSSLIPFQTKENLTGGYIASNEVQAYFESLSPGSDLIDDLATINERIKMKMSDYRIDLQRKEELWGTALAVVKVLENGIEFIQIGDCMILAVYQTGEVRSLTHLQVDHLESAAMKKWKEGISKGITTRNQLMNEVKDLLVSNRKKSNSHNGYGVLNGEPEAVNYFEYGKINKVGLNQLIILTDGMFLPQEMVPKGLSYWSYIAEVILDKGMKQYAKNLIEVEETDPECMKYPRFKKSDDKAGVVIHF
ncbi:protein phosphatase 2C domain-containing protein [Guptibacillus hwajinpoensis]|uniref:Serine/threonine protein phosphatase PrpC n=1 Tax=Guptibacillus hwajinpoensis TaxID=208199 RepID=A0ABU0K113_9BACL|nr:protein phosphatase 2C domain-containing protein [Alkalihalobacillus hemicentroti]MDQ0481842.1 serine/threonine protein phosphatase PrpC [Alkalihalobacillus hemicentroti]